ncbi:MAG TPA: FAD-dependent oxidoreductase, partial [Sorangium sp.]|nr:FAD-dependent oxidoreductase [Sorangium sp.]
MSKKKDLLVIGNGMVGHKFIENMVLGGFLREWNITTFCEEPRLAYDRVNLSAFFSGKSADDLSMVKPGLYEEAGINVHLGDKAVSIDRRRKAVTSAKGKTVYYDKLILATGSYPFVPPIKGKDAKGCFVYRTIEDLEAMAAHAKSSKVGTVIGGGLLGLEAANALKNMGLEVHVVEFAPRLMALQVDEAGGAILRRKIESLGVQVHTSTSTQEIVAEHGRVARMLFADQTDLATDMIVFSAGIRPRDELARACELAIGNRGGVVINDRCQTSDPDIYAIGECASYNNQLYGLVAPGYHMAKVAADALTGGKDTFGGFDMSTKLKLMGVDVASFGDAFAAQPGARVVSFMSATSNVYKKLVVSADGKHLLGGILVGDASNYSQLLQLVQNKIVLPPNPEDLIVAPRDGAKPAGFGVEA